jgi:hypothetical protein
MWSRLCASVSLSDGAFLLLCATVCGPVYALLYPTVMAILAVVCACVWSRLCASVSHGDGSSLLYVRYDALSAEYSLSAVFTYRRKVFMFSQSSGQCYICLPLRNVEGNFLPICGDLSLPKPLIVCVFACTRCHLRVLQLIA